MKNYLGDIKDMTFAIIGLGLMGGSYCYALRNLGAKKIIAVERTPKVLEQALKLGIVDDGINQPGELLREADLVIICIYPDAMAGYLKNCVPYMKEGAVVTDIAGIKRNMVEEIQNILPDTMEFISGHPMAGRQASGLAMAEAKIFESANYIIVPSEKNAPETIAWMESFAKALKCKRTVQVTPEEHDRTIAYTSNLPHITAVALMDSVSYSDKTRFFVAGSFRDGTRVADINPELWAALFMANKEKVADEVDRYIDQLLLWRDALRNGDAETMKELMRTSGARRKDLYDGNNPC